MAQREDEGDRGRGLIVTYVDTGARSSASSIRLENGIGVFNVENGNFEEFLRILHLHARS